MNDIHHVHSIIYCFTTFVTGNNGNELIFMPKELFENNSKDFISNTRDTVNVNLATDDDKQLKALSIIYKLVSFQL